MNTSAVTNNGEINKFTEANMIIAIFKSIDLDGDGNLSRDELC